ncbi:MAG: DUF2793 domain-containing protein [Sphingomonadales bacterium]|nr:DUF2793 domain-containing protein [Sphingomonadales bacterium]
MAQTDRLGMPLLVPGQAQKEVSHNEALTIADMAIQLTVETADIADPPAAPVAGQCWVVAEGAVGAWLGRDGSIAGWTAAGWMFVEPEAGWHAWALDRENAIRFDGAGWNDDATRSDGFYVSGQKVVGERQSAIAAPTGGASPDAEARAAIAAILTTLRTHGLIAS